MKALYRGNKIFLVLLASYLSCEKRIASESVLFLVTDKESTPAYQICKKRKDFLIYSPLSEAITTNMR